MDSIKPSPNEVKKKYGIADKDGESFIRSYEAEIMRTIEAAWR